MEHFDKRMALEVFEDALTDVDTPHGRGMAVGLCGAFYMCGLFTVKEWEDLLKRIPLDAREAEIIIIDNIQSFGTRGDGKPVN